MILKTGQIRQSEFRGYIYLEVGAEVGIGRGIGTEFVREKLEATNVGK